MEFEGSEGNWHVAIGNLSAENAENETVADFSRLLKDHV
jgi:hypothetical protein